MQFTNFWQLVLYWGTCLLKENVADTSCDSDNNGNIRYIVLPSFSCTHRLGGSL